MPQAFDMQQLLEDEFLALNSVACTGPFIGYPPAAAAFASFASSLKVWSLRESEVPQAKKERERDIYIQKERHLGLCP